jgi:choline kinase
MPISIVFMVAGMSSRFGGRPKQMAKVGPNNETLIEYSVNQALLSDFSEIIFITNPRTEQLFMNIFGDEYKNKPVKYIQQRYDTTTRLRPWGTTDAICELIGNVQNSFILLNGDDIYGAETFKNGLNVFTTSGNNIIGGCKVIDTLPDQGNVNRGIIQVNNNDVVSIVETFDISKNNNLELHDSLASVNFIGLHLKTLDLLKIILDEFKENNKGDQKIECMLPCDLDTLIQTNKINMQYFTIKNKVVGLTNPEDEEIVKKILANH